MSDKSSSKKSDLQKDMNETHPSETISGEAMQRLITMSAKQFGQIRKIRAIMWQYEERLRDIDRSIPSTQEEMISDWRTAQVFIALKVLRGVEMGLSSLHPDSYPVLEDVWVEEIKQQLAYFHWENNKHRSDKENYYSACNEIRGLLLHKEREPVELFAPIRLYLEENYLRDGSFSVDKSLRARQLVTKKAEKIALLTQTNDAESNWFRAEMYARLFYENILSAAETSNKMSISKILRAFEFGKAKENNYQIANVFEVATTICYLDKSVLAEVITNPESYDYSMVMLSDFDFDQQITAKYSDKLMYDKNSNELIFMGVMAQEERIELLKAAGNQKCAYAVESLYRQSNMMPFEDMVL